MATTENTYTTSNATTRDFAFTFPYLKEADVGVRVNEIYQQPNTYTFHNATTIRLNTAPASGIVVTVFRLTDDSSLSSTFYPGSAIRSSDLNDNFIQNLYTTQECNNQSIEAILEAYSASQTADAAVVTANSADVKADAAVVTADDADVKADAAVVTANAADAIADAAKLATDTYVHDGTNLTGDGLGGNPQGVKYAVDQAVAAVASATTANNTADAADEIADDAKLATDRLVGTTSNNGSTWTVTGNNTNASTDPKGLGYAITTADDAAADATQAKSDATSAVNTAGNAATTADAVEDTVEKYVADANGLKGAGTTHGQTPDTDPRGVAYAVATAESAAASVAQSAIYTVVNNFAALPALTDASLSAEGASPYYQVTDSTLIQNQSTVTGEPANFIGDDELAVKLKANITASPKVWEWQEYYATDPETRYRKKLIVENLSTISEDYTIGIGNNGLSVGPVEISSANTVTIPANSRYVVL